MLIAGIHALSRNRASTVMPQAIEKRLGDAKPATAPVVGAPVIKEDLMFVTPATGRGESVPGRGVKGVTEVGE